jgi:hypothetical protein
LTRIESVCMAPRRFAASWGAVMGAWDMGVDG